MKFRYYYLFVFFTLLFLFYPGNGYYFNIFSYNRPAFITDMPQTNIKFHSIPLPNTAPFPLVSADGVYVLDLPSYSPILEKNVHKELFPASTTKIITALVAMDVYKPDQVVTVKRTLNDGQVMGLETNEQITVENLLYGILVHSGNDAAYALADYYGFDKYVKLMNEKAQTLGMKDSHFANPAGLDDPTQQTTPFDLALASRELLKNKLLRKIVGTKEIIISDIDFKIFHKLSNVNQLLGEIQGIGGLKTGYTENAGENLVSFYRKNGHEFLIVILKSNDRFADTRNVVKWLDDNMKYIEL